MRAVLLLIAAVSALPGTAQAEAFLRLVERPVIRFLLTETRTGRSLMNQLLGRSGGAGVIGSGDLRRAAATLEGESWARFSLELEDRVASAEDMIVALRERAARMGGRFDAVEFLHEYAIRELEASAGGLFGSRRLAFTNRAGTSLAAVRERFVSEMGAAAVMDMNAALRMESELEGFSARLSFVDTGARFDARTLGEFVGEFRSLALEIAVRSAAESAAFSSHRLLVGGLRARLIRTTDRLLGAGSEVVSLADARARSVFRAELEETRSWFASTPHRLTP